MLIRIRYVIFVLCFALCPVSLKAIPAFPGAEGAGANTTHGRGGQIVRVTNLNPTGPGSLKEALRKTYKRIIIFDVGGIICPGGLWNALVEIPITNGEFYLAGQTAPGGFVCKFTSFKASGVSDMLIRHLTMRSPSQFDDNGDVIQFGAASNVMIDHLTASGGCDEIIDITTSSGVTIQWSMVHEACQYGSGNCAHSKGTHNYGLIWSYLADIPGSAAFSLHHNIISHLGARYPCWCGTSGDCTTEKPGLLEMVNNVIYAAALFHKFHNPSPTNEGGALSNMIGNTMSGSLTLSQDGMFDGGDQCYKADNSQDYIQAGQFVSTPFTGAGYPQITAQGRAEAYTLVMAKAGALPRDSTSRRIVREIGANAGTSDCHMDEYQLDAPQTQNRPAGWDTDRDGMPDYWETANGLNPNDSTDNVGTGLSVWYTGMEGYTNVECYLNRLSDSLVNGVSTVVSSAEVKENENRALAAMISVFPNPFNPVVTISIGLDESIVPLRVMIYDVSGRLVTDLSKNVCNGSCIWNAAGFPSALYCVRVMTGTKIIAKRITLVK